MAGTRTLLVGWLDLYAVEAGSRWRRFTLAPALKTGRQVDGELGPHTPATIVVVPRSLAVFCP
jgi:hypothetical protein